MLQHEDNKWIVAQLGARMHYAVPRLMDKAGKLEHFFTDIYSDDAWLRLLRNVPQRWQPTSLRRLLGRKAVRLSRELITSFPTFGMMYYLRRRLASDRERLSRVHLWAGTTFGEHVVRTGFGTASAVYTFNTAALEILQAARGRGLFTVVEQTIAPRAIEEELLAKEHLRFPEWEPHRHHGEATALTVKREFDEWVLADLIVCGSEFVKNGIAQCGGPVERCVVVPYGVDLKFKVPRRKQHDGPLRVLTVGDASLRKGVAYALEVAKALQGVAELRWVGPISLYSNARTQLTEYVQLTGNVPRSEIMQHYEWADVFFLPSVCEGSATVIYEAQSCGLPVLTTLNSGSTVCDSLDGFITTVGDVMMMIARLQRLHENRALLAEMSVAAAENSRNLSLLAYQKRLLEVLN